MSQRMKGRVALVTGSSRGIGRGVAIALAQEGARVAVNYVNREDSALEVVERIQSLGSEGIACQANVAEKEQVDAMVVKTVEAFGRIDLLVNNAGIVVFKDYFDFSAEDWDYTCKTNVRGLFLACQAVAREMRKTGGGNIVGVASIAGERVTARSQIAYCASKAGYHALIRYMAVALAPYGIRVNAVLPGGVPTDQNAQFLSDPGALAFFSRIVPLGRLGIPEDVAGAVKYFASKEAGWVTGSLLVMDGGYILR
ncbi:MAG: hypothetical protein CMH76_10980 [Nitrospinae bacterium]|nr:hypothetical protein [Nitrospinota bacterium]